MNELFRWSTRAARQERSPIREMLRAASRPGLISLAGGMPAAACLPSDEVRAAAEVLLRRDGPSALQYGETEGCPELRDAIAKRESRPGLSWGRDNVLVTSGSQQALDLIGRCFLDPGDTALVENPTYLAALGAWRLSGARFAEAPADGDGLLPDALRSASAEPPRLLYVIPNFQNPQGVSLAAARRQPVAAAAAAAGAVVVEDDPYGELWFEGPPPPSIMELANRPGPSGVLGNVLRVGSFSKTLAPGLRVGWVLAPAVVIDRLATLKQAADLHTGSLDQLLILQGIQGGWLDARLPVLRSAYRDRRDAMLDALDRRLRGLAEWNAPAGGFFIFLRLPAGRDAAALLPEAVRRGVAFAPGAPFHLNGGAHTLRLSFSHASPADIQEGVHRLAGVIESAP